MKFIIKNLSTIITFTEYSIMKTHTIMINLGSLDEIDPSSFVSSLFFNKIMGASIDYSTENLPKQFKKKIKKIKNFKKSSFL